MNSEKFCAAIIIAIIKKRKREKTKGKKRIWTKQWLKNRKKLP